MPQVPLPNDHDVVEAFPADRADQSLRTAILPRRSWRDRLVADAQRSHATNEYLAVAGISITDLMVGCWLPFVQFTQPDDQPVVIDTERILTTTPMPPDGVDTRIISTNGGHQDVRKLITDVLRRLKISV